MTTHPVASYDRFADWYDDWLGEGTSLGSDPFALPLLELIGSVTGQRVQPRVWARADEPTRSPGRALPG